MSIITFLDRQSRPFILILGILLIILIGGLDHLTGYELSFSVFYIVPIALITWHAGWYPGVGASVVSAVVWLVADYTSGHGYTHSLIPVWNSIIRFLFFIVVTLLLSRISKTVQRESALARIDYLTGAVNSRFFYEVAQMEIDRLKRYGRAFTLAYIDLDNFKNVNDRFGHTIGNEVLRTVVVTMEKTIRKTDTVARIGGDEFVLLLPETDLKSAQTLLGKIQKSLLNEMSKRGWPVTFSIGSLTCGVAPEGVDDLVRMTDEVMYTVKSGDKNAVHCVTYPG